LSIFKHCPCLELSVRPLLYPKQLFSPRFCESCALAEVLSSRTFSRPNFCRIRKFDRRCRWPFSFAHHALVFWYGLIEEVLVFPILFRARRRTTASSTFFIVPFPRHAKLHFDYFIGIRLVDDFRFAEKRSYMTSSPSV